MGNYLHFYLSVNETIEPLSLSVYIEKKIVKRMKGLFWIGAAFHTKTDTRQTFTFDTTAAWALYCPYGISSIFLNCSRRYSKEGRLNNMCIHSKGTLVYTQFS